MLSREIRRREPNVILASAMQYSNPTTAVNSVYVTRRHLFLLDLLSDLLVVCVVFLKDYFLLLAYYSLFIYDRIYNREE